MAVSVISNATTFECTSLGTAPSGTINTVCFWARLDTAGATFQTLFSLATAGGHYLTVQMDGAEDSFVEHFSSGADNTVSGPRLVVGTWYFFTATINGTNPVRIYYATAADATITTASVAGTGATSSTYTKFALGKSYDGDFHAKASFQALKIWSGVELTADEIANERWFITPQRTNNLYSWNPLLVLGDLKDYAGGSTARDMTGGSATVDGPPISWARARGKRLFIASGAATTDTFDYLQYQSQPQRRRLEVVAY